MGEGPLHQDAWSLIPAVGPSPSPPPLDYKRDPENLEMQEGHVIYCELFENKVHETIFFSEWS